MKNLHLILIFALALLSSCGMLKKSGGTTSANGTGAIAARATLSTWSVFNGAWSVLLDLNGVNLNGLQFTLVYKFSDHSETHCDGVLNGSESSGLFTSANCVASTGMSASTPTSTFEFPGNGSYSNNGTELQLCRGTNNCISYY